ncbi:MAG: hypothetical protein EAZ16_12935 [Sphingobacteriales bacterium]|nr:MAG: hypothetical protein EAZ16_12935 [Sphingobacteriales bacterium]
MKYFFSSLLLLISIYANAQTPAFFNKTKLLFVNAPLEKTFSDWVKYFADNKGRFELETNTNPFEYLYSVAAKDIDTQYIPFNGKLVCQIKKYDYHFESDTTIVIPVESFLIGTKMRVAINKKEINQFKQKQKE